MTREEVCTLPLTGGKERNMRTHRLVIIGLLAAVGLCSGGARAANIAWFKTYGGHADEGLIARLTAAGHTVTEYVPASGDPDGSVALAEANDLAILSESLQSSHVSASAGVFHLKDVTTPVISFESHMFDDAQWTGTTRWIDYGHTGVSYNDLAQFRPSQDTLYIVDHEHPAAGGFPAGPVQVFSEPYGVNYGVLGADADVIATADAAGEFPSTFVYEAEDHLADGSVTPGMRMALFIGQTDNALQFSDLSDDGLALFDAAVAFGLTRTPEPHVPDCNPGDADDDGDVDDDDLSLLLANWGSDVTGEGDGGCSKGEFNDTAPVDDDDLSLLLANWTGQLSAAIPEPTALGLLAVGAVAIRRRRTPRGAS